MDRNELLKEIAQFCAERKWTEITFGTRANDDSRLVDRIRRGVTSHRITERVEKFLEDERAKRKEAAE